MAYKTTTKTYVVEDHYDGGSADRWQRATLKVTVDAKGNGSWKITMNNDSSVNGYGTGRAVYLKVLIDGDYIAGSASSSYTTHGSDLDAPGYREYPCGNNTSDSGTFTVSSASFDVSMTIVCMQMYSSSRVDDTAVINTTFTRDQVTLGSGSISLSQPSDNTFDLSYVIKEGTNNGVKTATLYWDFDYDPISNPDPNGYSYKNVSSAGTHKWGTFTVPSTKASYTVYAALVCMFEESVNGVNSITVQKTFTVKYYGDGTAPSTPTIKDNKNNTYTISGNVGTSGHNNTISSAKLNYTIAGVAQTAKTLTTASGGTYTYTFNTPTNTDSTAITAQVVRTMSWAGATVKNSTKKTATIPYYAPIKTNPAVSITDNGNNTFTITGTNATGGNVNNTLATTYSWSYDSGSYNQSGAGTKTLTIATPSNATRAVYAKANATLSVFGDPVEVKALTNPVYIKQYVAPGNPGTPVLSYSKSRLTIKEPWIFTWTAAAPTNTSSPVAGYRLTLFKNGTERSNSIPIKNSSGTDISRYVDSVYIYDTTSLSFTVDPVQNGFAPGDTIVLAVRPYTKTATGVCLYNANNTYSAVATVQNAGVVHVKQNGQWHEGQVWVKVAGVWKEAETVNVKVNGAWKESQ